MVSAVIDWFRSWSIRWKLQFGFFFVTMTTMLLNRWLSVLELDRVIEVVADGGGSSQLIQQLKANRDTYIFNAFWESGLELLVLFIVIGVIAALFVRPIKELCTALEAMERGDLTQEVAVTNRDEIGDLEQHFNGMLVKLNKLMHSINDSSKNMGQSAYQIAAISHEIAEVSKTERDSSSEVSNATDQLHLILERVQQLSSEASGRAKQTEEHAQSGIESLQANVNQMEQTAQQVDRAAEDISELEETAQEIHKIIAVITGIADQTNLLALNAAIEAARAGDQGRGFAVVADEVRSLASGTSKSADQISEMVGTLSSKVQQVASTMQSAVAQVHENQEKTGETAQVIQGVCQDVTEVAATNQEITIASEEQLGQLEFLRSKMKWLFETLDQSSAKVETTESIGNSLYELTEGLNHLMADYQFERGKQITRSGNEKRRYPRLNNNLLVRIEQDGQHFEGVTSDCSLGGVNLEVKKKLPSMSEVKLQLYIPYEDVSCYENQIPVEVTGTVARCSEKGGFNCYGIDLEPINDNEREGLRKVFDFFEVNAEY